MLLQVAACHYQIYDFSGFVPLNSLNSLCSVGAKSLLVQNFPVYYACEVSNVWIFLSGGGVRLNVAKCRT